jgi:hypothetical protein
MSQHDLDIANQGFPATRADLNLALKALGSLQSGATAPSTTYANMLWYDTANNILKIRNEDNDAFISLFTLDQTADNIEALTVNGNATADALVSDSITNASANLTIASTQSATIRFDSDNNQTNREFNLQRNASTSILKAEESGDITFFKDNGTTTGLFWDASSGSVNIGGTGGQAKFEVNSAVSTTGSLTDTTINLATTGVTGRKANIGFGLAGGVANTNAATIGFDVTNGSGALQGDLFFSTRGSTADSAPTERMRITSGGDVEITGGYGSSQTFQSTGALRVSSNSSSATANVALELMNDATSARTLATFTNLNGVVGSISTNGSATAFNTSSDHRLKEAVVDMTGAIDRVKALAPKRFNFIVDADTTVDGFLAHEAQSVVPEAVTGTKDAMMDEDYVVNAATGDIYTPAAPATYDEDGEELTAATDEVIHSSDVEKPEELADGQQWRETTAAVMGTRSVPDYQGIDQSKLVPLLTGALREAIAKIESLETRVAALEA